MINFISTFPPIVCGIASYTSYLVNAMPAGRWSVTSFQRDEFDRTGSADRPRREVLESISLRSPRLPRVLLGDVVWFQHSFGIWGDNPTAVCELAEQAKERRKKVVVTFHTVHFEGAETEMGLQRREEALLKRLLPRVDGASVFTAGAFQAVRKTFPEFADRVTLIRHGVPSHPRISMAAARRRLRDHLTVVPHVRPKDAKRIAQILAPDTIVLGHFGFVGTDKDPSPIYELGAMLRKRLPMRRIAVLCGGTIQRRKDRCGAGAAGVVARLRVLGAQGLDVFVEGYLPEFILPCAYGALDFAVFWPRNGTQSGTLAHAQGAGTCVVGRSIEGVGETLKAIGSPVADDLEDLAHQLEQHLSDMRVQEVRKRAGQRYRQLHSFSVQARQHLVLEAQIVGSQGWWSRELGRGEEA